MLINSSEPNEDRCEISLNETSLKKPLDVVDVIGGHGPWQFRQWIVFFGVSLCNSMLVFSALFLPVQTFCFDANTTVLSIAQSSVLNTNKSELLGATRVIENNRSSEISEICNSTECNRQYSLDDLDTTSLQLVHDMQCWNSQTEIFIRCIYMFAFILSAVLVYFLTKRFNCRSISLISCLFLVVSLATTSLADKAPAFIVLRFFTALGILNIYLISTFSLMEFVHKDYKTLYFLIGHLGWSIAYFLLPVVAWLATGWTSFNLFLTFICIVLAFFVWWAPEYPSLFSSGTQLTRSKKALKYAAFTNGYSTSDVDMLSHGFHLQQEKHDDIRTLTSWKGRVFLVLYLSVLFIISFSTAFLYFSAKWHPEWLKVQRNRISFSFLGSTEIASTIILLFLSCFISIKYLWACACALASAVLLVIYYRTKEGPSISTAMLYTVAVFFSSAAWTLMLAKSFCHKITSTTARMNLIVVGVALFAGALVASISILKDYNRDLLLAWAVPNLFVSLLIAIVPNNYFGSIA